MESLFSKEIIGYDQISNLIFSDIQNSKLHHAILLASPEGSGKKKLAYLVADQLLNKYDNSFKVDLAQHPDVKIIKSDLNESKKGEITIKQIRELNGFINLKSSIANCRIIIIDAIDDLNLNAANSLLKILEEPPHNCFFICLSHKPENLLATIKSRVLIYKLPRLSKTQTLEIINNQGYNLEQDHYLIDIFPKQPGLILKYLAEDYSKIASKFEQLLNNLDNLKIEEFLGNINLKEQDNFLLVSNLLSHNLAQKIKENLKLNKNINDNLIEYTLTIPAKFNECFHLNLDRSNFLRITLQNLNKLNVS